MSQDPVQRPWFFGLIAGLSALAYGPALNGTPVWDDDAHVTRPALQSLAGLGRIWSQPGATQQYYPLLHTAFWAEHRLWGDAPLGYHLLNVFLHAGAAWLFALILRELGARAAWLGGMLFALHPVAVESVAWISEQKNTLSAVFYLAAALLYLRGGRYSWATALFVGALLTKSVTATLPAALLVGIWYRKGRLSFRTDVAPLLPWFVLGAGMGLFTAWVEHTLLGASGRGFDLSAGAKCLLAARIAFFYLGKVVWPRGLLFVYPHWTVSAADPHLYVALAGLLVGLGMLGRMAWRGRRGPLACALFFLGTLFPVLGFFNVYPFLFSYVADHFQYLAMLGVLAAAAAGWAAWRSRDATTRPHVAAFAALGLCAALTWRQCRNYRDAETLYRSVLTGNPECWMAEYNLGVTLHRDNRIAEATGCYERAIALRPEFPQAQNNLGVILTDAGRGADAVPHLEAAVAGYAEIPRLARDGAEAEGNLGRALQAAGRDEEAIGHFSKALAIEADRPELRNNYAVALIRSGRPAEAEAQFETALRLHPDDRTAQENLARLRRILGQ